MGRGIAWLLMGLGAFVVLVVLTAPELVLSDLQGTTELAMIAGLAGLPGLILLLVIAAKRRGTEPPQTPPDEQINDDQER